MFQLLDNTDRIRLEARKSISQKKKSQYGQFMTPSTVARFMASLFSSGNQKVADLLDAGAGGGSLSSAFLDRFSAEGFNFQEVNVTAYEIDNDLRDHLRKMLRTYKNILSVNEKILSDDFICHAVNQILSQSTKKFTHAILNPPYKKIGCNSNYRSLLKEIGIETVNMYSAFVALTIMLMKPFGQIVTIIPRSFCNGPYYKPFRDLIFSRTSIKHIHLFNSRNKAFKDDDVLQENVIILLECGTRQDEVVISTSTDGGFNDYVAYSHPFNRIVFSNDKERFIHIPTLARANPIIERPEIFCHSLSDIGIEVSTGPVVDFRLKEYLCDMPKVGCVPLLYPNHFVGYDIVWPKVGVKKPNGIMRHKETEKWLYPNGFYTVVRRFSSKEEKRRIVANVVYPDVFDYPMLGFENHLNVFHVSKQGMQKELALGLMIYLNSTIVDEYFRQFNGHTQVNATDLRFMKYPGRQILIDIGYWASKLKTISQENIDNKILGLL